jgi:hypothetical protein
MDLGIPVWTTYRTSDRSMPIPNGTVATSTARRMQ